MLLLLKQVLPWKEEDIIGRDSRGTLGRLLLVPQSECPGHTQAGGRPTLRLN